MKDTFSLELCLKPEEFSLPFPFRLVISLLSDCAFVLEGGGRCVSLSQMDHTFVPVCDLRKGEDYVTREEKEVMQAG